jgi:hypothetical protein
MLMVGAAACRAPEEIGLLDPQGNSGLGGSAPVPSLTGRTLGPTPGPVGETPAYRPSGSDAIVAPSVPAMGAPSPWRGSPRVGPALLGPLASSVTTPRTDILWQNLTTGYRGIWIMNGLAFAEWVSLGYVPPVWRMVCAADIYGDASRDVIWENSQTGERAAWELSGVDFVRYVGLPSVPVEWKISACADIDGNGRADIFWTNTQTGERGVWLMNGIAIIGWYSWGPIPMEWDLAGVADVDADNLPDILWSNKNTAERVTWRMNGTAFSSFYRWGQVPLSFTFVGAGDVDGNGRNDLVWRGADGRFAYWLLNGLTFQAYREGEIAPPDWTVAALTRFSVTPPGRPVTMSANVGSGQTAAAGTSVTTPPSVRVLDGYGQPVSGVTVVFSAQSGSGSVTGATAVTGASGIATVGSWTLGPSAGAQTLVATATSLPSVTFTATATAPVASQLAVITQPAGATSGTPFTSQPVVEIRDASGNRLTSSTLLVTATVESGTGTLGGVTSVVAVNGVATFANLGVIGSGAHRLRFSTTSPLLAVSAPDLTVSAGAPGIRLNVGTFSVAQGIVGSDLSVPLVADLSTRGSVTLAALTITVSWDPTKLSYVGNTAGSWVDSQGSFVSPVVNSDNAVSGVLRISGYSTSETTTSFILRNLQLRPLVAGTATVTAVIDAAGDEMATNITVTPRNLTVTASTPP